MWQSSVSIKSLYSVPHQDCLNTINKTQFRFNLFCSPLFSCNTYKEIIAYLYMANSVEKDNNYGKHEVHGKQSIRWLPGEKLQGEKGEEVTLSAVTSLF